MSADLPWPRLAAVAAIFAALNAGPLISQGLGYPPVPGLKTWRMYRGFGADICIARFEDRRPDGTSAPLDRFEVLKTTRADAPRYITFIPSEAQVARTGKTMCRRMPGKPHVFVDGECGSRYHWQPMTRLADVDLCGLTEADLGRIDKGGTP